MTIFKAIVGSRAYGTDIETSDTDYKGVYMQSTDDLISFGYKEQKDENKYVCHHYINTMLAAVREDIEDICQPIT